MIVLLLFLVMRYEHGLLADALSVFTATSLHGDGTSDMLYIWQGDAPSLIDYIFMSYF